jgi:RNA polymerase sigma factor (sigma-70 family)
VPEPIGTSPRYLGALFDDGCTAGLTDGQLLERFATRRREAAEAAFAAIVERHGPMVLRACRGLLRDEHAARDASQATFLALVRRSRSLWVADSLAPWLHRVACRAAGRLRREAEARRRRERRAAEGARGSGVLEAERRDLAAAIHEEVNRLPMAFRQAVVLCDLEGRSYEDAARQAGCAVGTVKSRLARGRGRLRDRLIRRGLAPAVGGSLAASVASASASVPADWADAVAREALACAMRRGVPSGTSVAGYLQRGLRAMRRHAIWSMGGLVAVGIVAGLAMRVPGAAGQQDATAKTGGAVAPAGPKAGVPSAEEIARIRDRVVDLRAEQDVAEIEREIAKAIYRDLARHELEVSMTRLHPGANEKEAEAERMRLDESRAYVAKAIQETRRRLHELSIDYNRRQIELLDADTALAEATKAGRR